MTKYKIARIVNTHGIKGQLKIIADTDFVEERFASGNRLSIVKDDKVLQEVHVASIIQSKGTYIVAFDEFHNINEVEVFKGAWLAIDEDQQEVLDDDSYYHHQIVGLKVVTTEGVELGTIKEILALGSNDVWVVKRKENGKKDALIPFIKDVVKDVDLDRQVVVIELMEGLIDDAD
ncbi:ribosome maturation factor RimM [Fundicoccus culcitae]|uniref:Ribosome maturation factor RimM n=1 Tax=Fundicoccus culcitae TaxID=2969821 RepID=A0ABY5P672_9LACT|nr:ribosome maturation factor RimM [Fundicoccus culcitae]UUX34105.1 ribosome maturation factor RimM [Fundicoccus culcitae]